tara:strand:- start:4891 stop:5415 length:525 start_codon:yes stop_codon:yes gene_type:complete
MSVGFIFLNENYKWRFYNQVEIIFEKDGFDKYLKSSEYGAHYDTAYKIFERNKVFGIGIKNFREESSKSIYRNNEYTYTSNRSKTHPHQIHFELLAETGLFGYSVFIIFIVFSLYLALREYFKRKSIYQLSSIVFISVSLLPYLPSGSFYSSFNSSIFWLNYAIMMSFVFKKNN